MSRSALEELQGLLHPEGGFTSVVTHRTGREVDRSGFVAAMVLRSLRQEPDSPALTDIRSRSLDWLWRCRSSRVSGAFMFWPNDVRPRWATSVPADVDDTVVMLAELVRYRRVDRLSALRSLCFAVLSSRVMATDTAMLPPWVSTGSFFTWIAPTFPRAPARRRSRDVVDCCVNTNVVALMSLLDAKHLPGYDAAIRTVIDGLRWAGRDAARLRSLSPFYPSLWTLADALEHAAECGAAELDEGLLRLRSVPSDVLDADRGLCGGAYGGAVWHAPAVHLARAIARSSVS